MCGCERKECVFILDQRSQDGSPATTHFAQELAKTGLRMPARRHGARTCSEPSLRVRFPDSCLAEGMPAPEAIFRPVVSGEAVATSVLIENSPAMVQSDLRDHHLPTLLGTMRLANSIVPVSRDSSSS